MAEALNGLRNAMHYSCMLTLVARVSNKAKVVPADGLDSDSEAGWQSASISVRSVERAGRIITALAEHPYPMGVRELAPRVDLSPGSTHRMLTTLVRLGWVDRNTRTSQYRLATRMFGIGSAGLVTSAVVQTGRLHLNRLAAITGHDAVLSTLVGARVVHLARVQGASGRVAEFEAGVSQPAHAMADGKLLMAFLPESERRYLYKVETLRRYTARTIVEPEELENEFAKIRERGVAIDHHERFEATRGVSVPILGADEKPILALLTMGKLEESDEYETSLIQQMLAVANDIADQLTMSGDMPMPGVEFARYNLE